MQLGLRHQGVLCSSARGCDTAPKDDPSKVLARCLRGFIFNSYDPNPSSFIERVEDRELRDRMIAFLKNCDHYPQHYVSHLMHAAEILGYKHPTHNNQWLWFYRHLCDGLHVHSETEVNMERRLSADEAEFRDRAAIA